ncbi:Phosphoglycolate phosphatase, HAD superfamily [Verrucomicrobium sp. GAS474]|uniref:HAD family hydrolase n=1 Tax=Verrucomicrobium sp. GAS474 TaxID=1882831 RepID=UPI00087D726B|nr:HAD family hydrolase [Verrucomicrobium sp. GAS474]SDT92693.1 Phosphoglycolate phosphatase, HAD superfamily [Verrucomicrobium sp. GAS474]
MKLLLWDIDGTLVCTGKAGEVALLKAIKEKTGAEGSLGAIDYKGRTDLFIARQILDHYGHPVTSESLHAFTECYLKHLSAELPRAKNGRLLPGVLAALEAVKKRKDIAQGLLTGNLVKGARLKLDHYSVWHYFEFGAFADDSHIRNDLGPYALQRAKDRHGKDFLPGDVFIIGDTPHDIACAKIIGANSIAVATGSFTKEELLQHEPTAYFDDLSDLPAFFQVVETGKQ